MTSEEKLKLALRQLRHAQEDWESFSLRPEGWVQANCAVLHQYFKAMKTASQVVDYLVAEISKPAKL